MKRLSPNKTTKRVSIRRNVAALSMPVLLSSLFQRLVSIVDIFMVGGLGAAAIAATGLGQLLIFVTMTVFWGFSTGANVVIAHLWGAGRRPEARRTAFASLLFCALLAVAATLLGIGFGRDIAVFLGASPDVLAYASDYIRLVFLYFGFTAGLNILSAIMQGTGNTRTPMEGILLVNVLHVAIAYPLIYGHLGFPRYGVLGAAYAINLSEAAGFCYLLVQAFRKGYLKIGRPDLVLLKKVLAIGYPVALERIAQQSGQLFYSKFIIGFGTAAYAAHQIGLSIESLSFMPGAGMGIAAATLMGQSIGARKLKRAHMSHTEALRLAVLVMACMALLFFFLPHQLIALFTHDPDVIEKGSVFLRLVAFAQVPLAISFVYAGSLRGTGDTHYVFLVTLASMWGIRVLLSYLAAVPLKLSLYAVWSVFLIDWFVRAGAFWWRYQRRDLHQVII
ncbi:MATE family efflux transporter [Geomonas sp. Red69]|uniref:Multidrug-efflux transporter n=1 Tax=Geomonas diazotrophica TaxID=2843197 RepID=A0ABX8JJ41_9BACT|nr:MULTISPECIES: MATE family efflux transporter [Geomonas]MBU5638401.1 MATE family efflux transporter [Geomonas diazotrophica]QWV97312.1 MATE family efflux transporter [Geomonas nitrogeniifigens]QXE86469.1 MATE family efflux transporter [Geomonas nitrogeniifigens]